MSSKISLNNTGFQSDVNKNIPIVAFTDNIFIFRDSNKRILDRLNSVVFSHYWTTISDILQKDKSHTTKKPKSQVKNDHLNIKKN